MSFRKTIIALLALALGAPILQSLLAWVAVLLQAMGDAAAASVVRSANTAIGVLWIASLVALVVTLALKALTDDRPRDG